jgi:putative oxidoreductase
VAAFITEIADVNQNLPSLSARAPQLLALLRIVSAYLFLLHGSAKLLGVPHVEMFDNLEPLSLIGLAGVLELVGGVLLLIGLYSRPVAFVLSGEMAFAYFIGHASRGTPHLPLLNGGESAVLFCFVFLYLAAAGPGAWAVDTARTKVPAAVT